MTPIQLAREVEICYDFRDRAGMTIALAKLVSKTDAPDLRILTREQLEERRNAMHTLLADINGRLIAMGHAGRRTAALPLNLPPMEASD